MRAFFVSALFAVLTACSSSTDTAATRYNFAVVDGRNQSSSAGAATLAHPITSQLTRDPQGKFATRVFDFLAPAKAYAQGLSLAGDPVANAIVCGRVAPVGEPQVIPLCAFTLADGKAANSVQGGTKAGTYNILFSAQVASQEPVVDSTTVVVEAGAPADVSLSAPFTVRVAPGAILDLHPFVRFVRDEYGNEIDWNKLTPQIAIRDGSEIGAPTPDSSSWTVSWTSGAQWSGKAAVYLYAWFGGVRWRSSMAIQFE